MATGIEGIGSMSNRFLLLATLLLSLALAGAAQDSSYYAGCGKDPHPTIPLVQGLGSGPLWAPERVETYEVGSRWDASPQDAHVYPSYTLQKAFGIQPNKEALRSALHNDDVRVRQLAAWALADQDEKDAIPDIFHALEAEKVPRAKAYLACALAELGDARGVAALHQYCETDGFPSDVRSDVVLFLMELHQTTCLMPVEEALQGNWPTNWGVTTFIGTVKRLSPEDAAQLRKTLVESLTTPGSMVRHRLLAAQTLSEMRYYSALPEIETALEHEPNPEVRKEMQKALENYLVAEH